jgi:uncharacterized protein (TIGR02300 family)
MNTASEVGKARRGAKRVCQACEVRFYDLCRQPIVCPSCGAHYTPVPQSIGEAWKQVAPFIRKRGWRSKQPLPTHEADLEASVFSGGTSSEGPGGEIEMATEAVQEDDVVLEPDSDDGDVSPFVDHGVEGPKEQ